MTNKEIARSFQLLAKMMELHGENDFRIRAYRNAYDALKKMEPPVSAMSIDELKEIKGIGSSTAEKIKELIESGRMDRFEQYARKTPVGIQELLMIKGLGPGKVKSVWKGLGIESPGELLYACQENRLVELSGFGLKTQAEVRKQLEYYLDSTEKFLWASLEPVAEAIMKTLKGILAGRIDWVGQFARRDPVVASLEAIVEDRGDIRKSVKSAGFHIEEDYGVLTCSVDGNYELVLHISESDGYDVRRLEMTMSPDFAEACREHGISSETLVDMPAELLVEAPAAQLIRDFRMNHIIREEDIKGVVHCHSTYSDGIHSLREMAEYTRDAGFGYLGITDHSQSAVYARGLRLDRVQEQWDEIEDLNEELSPFRIFRGIESDILADGSLDYEDDTLRLFDFVISSVHSGLKMDMEKATWRLIRAIENPYTRILGHPTGRLLLAREGYPIDHHKVIDACAANNVAIELNANPQRLDIDSGFIPYAVERGVMISINPDAHSKESIHNMRFGVNAARRGGLTVAQCLNCHAIDDFLRWLESGK